MSVDVPELHEIEARGPKDSIAKARKIDYVIVDTAGRLHNKQHLMAELEKMKRISSREVPGAPQVFALDIPRSDLEKVRRWIAACEGQLNLQGA